jgi:hypothetical protein
MPGGRCVPEPLHALFAVLAGVCGGRGGADLSSPHLSSHSACTVLVTNVPLHSRTAPPIPPALVRREAGDCVCGGGEGVRQRGCGMRQTALKSCESAAIIGLVTRWNATGTRRGAREEACARGEQKRGEEHLLGRAMQGLERRRDERRGASAGARCRGYALGDAVVRRVLGHELDVAATHAVLRVAQQLRGRANAITRALLLVCLRILCTCPHGTHAPAHARARPRLKSSRLVAHPRSPHPPLPTRL